MSRLMVTVGILLFSSIPSTTPISIASFVCGGGGCSDVKESIKKVPSTISVDSVKSAFWSGTILPIMVSLRHNTPVRPGYHVCIGVLIDSETVLTSGPCAKKLKQARDTDQNLNSLQYAYPWLLGQRMFQIMEVKLPSDDHPSESSSSDIAGDEIGLVHLKQQVPDFHNTMIGLKCSRKQLSPGRTGRVIVWTGNQFTTGSIEKFRTLSASIVKSKHCQQSTGDEEFCVTFMHDKITEASLLGSPPTFTALVATY